MLLDKQHPALEYLLLTPDRKIEYRVQRVLTIQEWYQSFLPEHITGERITSGKARKTLGITPMTFSRLRRSGYFGKAEPNGDQEFLLSVAKINEIRNREAHFIPVDVLCHEIERQRYYIKRDAFAMKFKKYFETGIHRKRKSITIKNTMEIIRILNKRKEIIESWPTLHDIYQESGSTETKDTAHRRFLKILRENKMTFGEYPLYDGRGMQRGTCYKIHPRDYERLTAQEKEANRLHEGQCLKDVAERLDIQEKKAGEHVRYAIQQGLLNPLRTRRGRGGGREGHYVLTPKEIDYLAKIDGEKAAHWTRDQNTVTRIIPEFFSMLQTVGNVSFSTRRELAQMWAPQHSYFREVYIDQKKVGRLIEFPLGEIMYEGVVPSATAMEVGENIVNPERTEIILLYNPSLDKKNNPYQRQDGWDHIPFP